jgi:hypothetical protein
MSERLPSHKMSAFFRCMKWIIDITIKHHFLGSLIQQSLQFFLMMIRLIEPFTKSIIDDTIKSLARYIGKRLSTKSIRNIDFRISTLNADLAHLCIQLQNTWISPPTPCVQSLTYVQERTVKQLSGKNHL